MYPNFLPLVLQASSWLICLAWSTRLVSAWRGLPSVPNLLLPQHDLQPAGQPSIAIIVPARNEQKDVRACLESLLAQDYANLEVIAIDDRSTDSTGAVMDTLAEQHPSRMRVLHVAELPPGWLGKTHAMALAARATNADLLLFTDADIFFTPAAVRLALANLIATQCDHLVLIPTTIIRRWDEAALLSFFQILGVWAVRTWKVADPRARDAIGIGAFNLVRRSAYLQIGGFDALPMEIVEDLGLGRRIKALGLAQRVAFGRGLVRVHWAAGVPGLINVMTKNIFAAFNYHVALLAVACGWILFFCVWPYASLAVSGCRIPGLITVTAMAALYGMMQRRSGLAAGNVFFAPFAALLFCYALCRSMLTTLRQGGVIWRGTFYPLAELRRHTQPLLRSRARP